MSNPRAIFIVAFALLIGGATTAAAADDAAVIKRLTSFGKLDRREAGTVVGKVKQRMARSADNFTPPTDPLRRAVAKALLNKPMASNTMEGAKVRLRLFGGLNEWALEALFSPESGRIAECQDEYALSDSQCTALVAAAGSISLADAGDLAGGGSAPAVAAAKPAPRPTVAPAKPAASGGRFGSYDSGFRAPARAASKPAPTPVAAAKPVAARPAARPATTAAVNTSGMSTAEAYRARRAARMARLQEERKKKKEALLGNSGGSTGPKQPSPSKAQPAATASAAPSSKPAPGGAAPAEAAAPSEAAAPAPAEEAPAGLDDNFLDGLLSDPLGDG